MTTKLLPCLMVAAVLQASGEPQGARSEIASTHLFRVAFDGIPRLDAVQVRGLVSESPVAKGEAAKPVEIVIVRPVQGADALWQWRAAIVAGKNDVRTGQVDLLARDGTPVVSLVIRDAWPCKWVWPTLDAANPAPALEEVHLLAAEVRPQSDAERKERSPLEEMDEQLKRIRDKEHKKGS
ncbi:MAG: phage tail protein [Planctomycetota bacterium]